MSDPDQRPDLWIDSVIHAPARLQIVMQLFVIDAADATFLLNRTGLTWGNLSTHISKLEDAGYVAIEKTFQAKKPRTMLRLTEKGRTAFETYRRTMRQILSDTADA
jgi:DNA-binding MarR family transcriptional regulator